MSRMARGATLLDGSMLECVWQGRAQWAKGPLWCPQRGDTGQLLFVDVLEARLHAFDVAHGEIQSWPLDEPNGWQTPPAVSPDGGTLYHSDTAAGVIHAYDLAPDGELSNKREHIRFQPTQGYPDGMTCDAEGGLWVAHFDGGRVSRFLPDGSLDETLTLPASRVTSCSFGGPELDQLYITTASHERDREELAGALFRVVPGVKGMPPHANGAASLSHLSPRFSCA